MYYPETELACIYTKPLFKTQYSELLLEYENGFDMKTGKLICTQIFQSLALAVLKIPYAGYFLSGIRSNFIDYEGNILWYYTCTKKLSPLYVFVDKRCYKRIPIFYKNVHFVVTLFICIRRQKMLQENPNILQKSTFCCYTLPQNLFWGYSSPMWIKKPPQCSTIKP